jgi:hypothetical protein
MDTTTAIIVGAFLAVCVAAWFYLRRHPKDRAPDDDQGATPRGLEDE